MSCVVGIAALIGVFVITGVSECAVNTRRRPDDAAALLVSPRRREANLRRHILSESTSRRPIDICGRADFVCGRLYYIYNVFLSLSLSVVSSVLRVFSISDFSRRFRERYDHDDNKFYGSISLKSALAPPYVCLCIVRIRFCSLNNFISYITSSNFFILRQ